MPDCKNINCAAFLPNMAYVGTSISQKLCNFETIKIHYIVRLFSYLNVLWVYKNYFGMQYSNGSAALPKTGQLPWLYVFKPRSWILRAKIPYSASNNSLH